MGDVIHRAMVVTCSDPETLDKLHAQARSIFGMLASNPVAGTVNRVASFLIAPCGSKSGWTEDWRHQEALGAFKVYLRAQQEAGFYSEWVEVVFGHDLVGLGQVESVTASSSMGG